MKIKELKYLDLCWTGSGLKVTTYAKSGDGQLSLLDGRVKTGEITLNRTYMFSLMRFVLSLVQFNK